MILIQPFAKKPWDAEVSPKDYPHWDKLLELLYTLDTEILQVGPPSDKQITPNKLECSLKELESYIHKCALFICVDTFLQHYAWYYNKKGVVLWGPSDPLIFGHSLHINILKDRKHLRQFQFDSWGAIPYNPNIFEEPEKIFEILIANYKFNRK